jgi:hypothetical protein
LSVGQVKIVNVANTDLNDYVTTGSYYFSTSYPPINIPTGSNGWLIVLARDTGTVKQIWLRQGTPDSNDYMTFVRTFSANVWSAWQMYVTKPTSLSWQTCELLNGFAHMGNSLEYSKDNSGVVHVTGAVNRDTVPTSDMVITLLPAGYRPTDAIATPIVQIDTGWVGGLQVMPSGEIQLYGTIANPALWGAGKRTVIDVRFQTI